MRDNTVYALLDPRDGKVRYVGRTANPTQRKVQHLTLFPSETTLGTPYAEWKKELFEQGLSPVFKEIEKGWESEGYWIRYFLRKGQPLTNRKAPRRTPRRGKWVRYKGTPLQGTVKPEDVFDMRYFATADR